MEKIKKILKKANLPLKIIAGVSLITLSFGVVFGISATSFKMDYINLSDQTKRLLASKENSYADQNSPSMWNVVGMEDFVSAPTSKYATAETRSKIHQPFFNKAENGSKVGTKYYDGSDETWSKLDPTQDFFVYKIMNERYKISTVVIDGKDHTALDHSFNQSLYTGIIRYIHGGMKYKDGKWVEGIYDEDINAPTNSIVTEISQNIAYVQKPLQDTPEGLKVAYEDSVSPSSDDKEKDPGSTPDYPYLLHLVGYNHASPLSTYNNIVKDSKNNQYYNQMSGSIDSSAIFLYDGSVPNNQHISSSLFRADQSAFLCALATCCFFLKNINIYYSEARPLSIGAYGGINLPTVRIFMGGIQRGVELYNNHILPNLVDKVLEGDKSTNENFPDLVKFVNDKYPNSREKTEEIKEKIMHDLCVQIISLDKTNAYFTGSFVQGDALGISRELLNRQACAIICVAGPQGADTAQEIKSRSSNCIIIGVDSAMELSDFQTNNSSPIKTKEPEAIDPKIRNGIFKFSATKNISYFAQKQSELFTQDLNWDISKKNNENEPDPKRSICSIGYVTNGNLLNGGCGISEAGWYYLATILQYLELEDNNGNSKPFGDIWQGKDKQDFLKLHNIHLDNEDPFYNAKFEELATVPTGAEGASKISISLMNHYAMYSEFLGEILDEGEYGINFKKTEAINAGHSSILQWIDDNMYFIS